MLAIIGASGKLGSATLDALLTHSLLPASSIVCTTSSGPASEKWASLASHGVQVRHATFDSPSSLEDALAGCDAVFLVSSPRISLDFNDAPPGQGREKDHIAAIEAAQRAGVKHIYYTSLAFGNPSRAGVMAAHIRTEAFLAGMTGGMQYTIIREGLYNESWPLYFGHYDVADGDPRQEVCVAGDGKISWTAIEDMGLASALILAAPKDEYAGKTLYLSNTKDPKTLAEVAGMVSAATGKEVALKIVTRQDHEQYYVQERKLPEPMIKWWAKTYDAVRDGECLIKDTTLERLLGNRKPKPVEQTVREMLKSV